MPLYEYTCDACQLAFEELVSSSSPSVVCPRCQGEAVTRTLSVFATVASTSETPCASACSPGACSLEGRERFGCCGGSCSH